MKKGWQKRLWESGWKFKTDPNIEFGEYILQFAVWWTFGVVLVYLIDLYFISGQVWSYSNIIIIYSAGLFGSIIGYWLRHRKKK